MLSIRKRTLLALVLIMMTVLAGGCWDNKDINHRSLPIVMGIAKRNDQYQVVLQIPEPGLGATKLRVVEESGRTLNEIVDRISTNMESQVDLLHLKVVLFEREYAEEGINDSVESFMRAQDISPKTMAVICDEPLTSFFRTINSFNKNNGTALISFFEKNAGWNPQVSQAHIWQLYRSIHSYTHDTAIPIIKSGRGTVIESAGSGVIRGGRLVERITSNETLLLNAFNGISTQGKIEVMSHATVEIVSNTIAHQSAVVNGKPELKTRVNLKVSLLETRGQPTMDQIKQELETLLTNRFGELMAKIQSKQADILAAGQYFRTKLNRDQLRRWRTDYFPKMAVDIQFNIVIQNAGHLKADA
ncbi:Ger(x)C family spore germination protein [Paenibacillus sp. LHD-117]|uniref:Ger(x)C family spore germination protein n=1 Tax=Paenibacillus sp. LHD-117 TaxID=3071412 RepID=UPI0027E0A440|nr:Ger(x)C family spore germination protein [Paenibacillus sp. LHD-117]MDQ6419012.1 Ger(x)C family spore germination protein [Paenibacillus sp. LHD-117]